ncbi:hypothetical protein S58_09740 [Bradyrhizobium oligotrophicum S58]|uniref:Tlde1 domain-containing protein n=1 Tax=Bradyrhizobium oligotrophicum S58 TaxID=1245469 RepID=M4ZL65_9BRAD|nr:hypothetical protein S58_09740 [Bradyrhizobium oligotrophicum S58]
MWIYSQALGTIYRQSVVGDKPTAMEAGYAGGGAGLNNPDMQCLEDTGPIPRGDYVIGAPVVGPTDYALPLIPKPGTDVCNPPRKNFYIHGDYKRTEPPRRTGAASHGCIVMSRATRQNIWESGDTDLRVVDYSV